LRVPPKGTSDSGDKGNRFKGNKKDENCGLKFPGGFSLSDMEKIIEKYKSGSSLRESAISDGWASLIILFTFLIKQFLPNPQYRNRSYYTEHKIGEITIRLAM
jgi:hypothetical protein